MKSELDRVLDVLTDKAFVLVAKTEKPIGIGQYHTSLRVLTREMGLEEAVLRYKKQVKNRLKRLAKIERRRNGEQLLAFFIARQPNVYCQYPMTLDQRQRYLVKGLWTITPKTHA